MDFYYNCTCASTFTCHQDTLLPYIDNLHPRPHSQVNNGLVNLETELCYISTEFHKGEFHSPYSTRTLLRWKSIQSFRLYFAWIKLELPTVTSWRFSYTNRIKKDHF